MKETKSRKLVLSTETLRGLSSKELSLVRGAADTVRTCRTCGPPTTACPQSGLECIAV